MEKPNYEKEQGLPIALDDPSLALIAASNIIAGYVSAGIIKQVPNESLDALNTRVAIELYPLAMTIYGYFKNRSVRTPIVPQ